MSQGKEKKKRCRTRKQEKYERVQKEDLLSAPSPLLRPSSKNASPFASTFHPLQIALESAVVLYVMEFFEREGPAAWEVEAARTFSHVLASKGDILLYRSQRQGETADLFDDLAKSVAVLAHSPGGVLLWGKNLDAEKIVGGFVGVESAQAYVRASVERYYREVVTKIQAEIFLLPSTSLGTWDVIRWFEVATDDDLLQLRAENYSNALPDGTINVNGITQRVLESMMQTLAERRTEWSRREQVLTDEEREKLDQVRQLLQAREQGQSLLCHIDLAQAESWLSVFKHALLQSARISRK